MHKPLIGLATRLGALAAMLVCGACWSDDPKIVAYDASSSDRLKEACKRPKVPRKDGLVRLDEAECEALAFWPGFENDLVAAFKASPACKDIMLISYQKLTEVNAASATKAKKEPRWSLSPWPVWRWDMEKQRVVRDDKNEWFVIDSTNKTSAEGRDSLPDLATSVCTFVNR